MLLRWIFGVILVVVPLVAGAEDPRQITVQGEGSVEVVPDMATLSLGVVTEGDSAREAIDDNTRAMADVLARLTAEGIDGRDLQTSNFSVSPRFDYNSNPGRNRITGFVAQNMLTVRVRDLDRLGEILDVVASDGANVFNGLRFGLQAPDPARDLARKAAVEEGRRLAALYAEAAGVTLGPLQTLSDVQIQSRGPVMMMQFERAASSDPVPIAEGELTYQAQVTMVYAIE